MFYNVVLAHVPLGVSTFNGENINYILSISFSDDLVIHSIMCTHMYEVSIILLLKYYTW